MKSGSAEQWSLEASLHSWQQCTPSFPLAEGRALGVRPPFSFVCLEALLRAVCG